MIMVMGPVTKNCKGHAFHHHHGAIITIVDPAAFGIP
jgi:hypothetical protein